MPRADSASERPATEIRTPRLRLRPCGRGDLDALHRLFVLPEVRRYLFDDEEVDRTWVDGAIADSERLFDSIGVGLYLAEQRGELESEGRDCQPVGFVGFREFFDPPQLQLLYGLHPRAWGRGYATEMAREMVRRAFADLGLAEVIAAADRPNKASFAVMERIGLERWKETDEGLYGTVYYRLEKPGSGSA